MTLRLPIQPDFTFATLSPPAKINLPTSPARLRDSTIDQAAQMEARESESPTAKIKRLTMRNTSLQTSLDECLDKCHQQTQSILYSKLPKEIRDMIFEYATAQFEDSDRKYKETAFWYRPGHRAPHKTCTTLLLTCRRVWLEANALPVKQAVFTFWMRPTRGPPEKHPDYGIGRNAIHSNGLTKLNRENLTTLHYYLQMFVAESMFFPNNAEASLIRHLRPRVVRITIRHTDWWYWEDDEPLRLKDAWVQRVLDAPFMDSVNEFSLELETLERNKTQLQPIVDRLTKMKGRANLSDGLVTSFEISGDPYIWHWTGPSNIDDKEYEPYKGLKTLDYRVVTLKWKRIQIREEDLQDVLDDLSVVTSAAQPVVRQRHGFICGTGRGLRLAGMNRWAQKDLTFADYLMRKESMERAVNTQQQMEQRFRKMMADVEARKFEGRWRDEGSLMKFEGDYEQDVMPVTPGQLPKPRLLSANSRPSVVFEHR